MTEQELAALRDLRKTIDRWRRMVTEADCASQMEREAILTDLDDEMGEVLHTRLFTFPWWAP